MEAYKKTALHLHGLNKSDRQWLLGQLPEHQREKLAVMLDELRTLGIPQEPGLASDFDGLNRDSTRAALESQTVHGLSPYIEIIAQAEPMAVNAILNREPEAVVAAVLQISDWPWRQVVLEDFPLPRRHLISEAMKNPEGRLTEKTCEVVLQILAERLGDTSSSSAETNDNVPNEPKRPVRRWPFRWRRFWQK